VLRETTSRGLCGPVCPSRTSASSSRQPRRFSSFCCRARLRLRASCLPGIPRRTSRDRPRTQGHMHSEGHIIYRASRYLIRRATSFQSAHLVTDHFFLCVIFILYSRFPRSMFSHTASFLGAYSICMHHTSIFCFCPPPRPFSSRI
jgi:hypothetical protein